MKREMLKQRITKVKEWNVLEFNEQQAKGSIIEPIFNCLDWDVTDPEEVFREYKLPPEGRVDYAFLKKNIPIMFVEAKPPNKTLDNYTSQLLKYAFAKGVKLGVLTNGVEWWLYLPMEGGEWDERKFYSIDLKKQDIDEVCDRLIEFLGKEDVLSGKSIQNAKEMRQSKERKFKIDKTLPEVWKSIIIEPNEVLLDLLIEETERACGYKPDEFMVKSFLSKIIVPPQQAPPQEPTQVQPLGNGRGRGLLIYVPEINRHTFLHFSWSGRACALRDYSQSQTMQPKPDRRYSTSYVNERIKDQFPLSEHPNRRAIEFWYQKTIEANMRIKS
jgi:predicted type IV restriction endonuclease